MDIDLKIVGAINKLSIEIAKLVSDEIRAVYLVRDVNIANIINMRVNSMLIKWLGENAYDFAWCADFLKARSIGVPLNDFLKEKKENLLKQT